MTTKPMDMKTEPPAGATPQVPHIKSEESSYPGNARKISTAAVC